MDITQLLTFAIDNGAEQAIISAGSPPILRKAGELVFTKMDALTPEDTRNLVYSALGPGEIQKLEDERELAFTFTVREGCQCRGSVYFERGNIAAVFRIAPLAAALPAKLGLPSLVADAARAPRGLVVIAAPSGHGKSMALNSLVELVNAEREATILTVEKTIIHPHANKKSVIHQRDAGRDAMSILSAVDAAAEQDPDVLVIDPMDDGAVIRSALAFAGRGHLVLASTEADYVMETLTKLLAAAETTESPTVRRQLGAELTLVAAIRLLPRKDGTGRVPATEVLRVDADMARLIRDGNLKEVEKRLNASDGTGTWTMDSFILKLHERGLVDIETARRYLRDPKVLES